MRVLINDKEITFPSSLSEITLGQRIRFHQVHGQLLDKMYESIQQMKDELFKEVEMTQWHAEVMYRTFAFFANIDVEVVKKSQFVDKVAEIYYSSLAVLLEEEKELELQHEFAWQGQQWEIQQPRLDPKKPMTFGELIDAKQIVQDMISLGRGKWEYMIRLCAIYFRKKGEPYTEDLVQEDSERMKMLQDLPMSIAIHVGFFLSSSINIWSNTLQFSKSQEPKAPVIL